jgi:hypothetical protein
MIHRAKCKLCKSIISPKDRGDYVSCSCGEITVDCHTSAFHANIKNDKSNLILVDEDGNEIIPKQARPESSFPGLDHDTPQDTGGAFFCSDEKEDLLGMLDQMRANIGNLPKEARLAPVTHTDLESLLLLLSSIFRAS